MNNEQKLLANKLKYEGSVFTTQYGDVIIEKYNSYKDVSVRFLRTNNIVDVRIGDLKRNSIKDYLQPTVFKMGICGLKYQPSQTLIHYNLWYDMLKRCYDSKRHKIQPTYELCTVSDNFLHYEYFYEWCNNQIGFGNKGFELDKDLLLKGNKLYSENICVFLPREINIVLTKRQNHRGDFPIGVYFKKQNKKFVSHISLGGGGQKHLGYFDNSTEAFNAYKFAKEKYIKELAEEWKGTIEEKAYEALINYQVEITD